MFLLLTFVIYIFTVSDNTCTKVTSKILKLALLGTHVTVFAEPINIFLAAHARDKDCTNYILRDYVVKYKHSNVCICLCTR